MSNVLSPMTPAEGAGIQTTADTRAVAAATNGYTPPLHDLVEHAERRLATLEHLTGQILATLEINVARKTLTTVDDADFRRMLDAWQRIYQARE